MDLGAIPLMRQLWGYPVGLSDHTLSPTASLVAVALGATVIEKHVTLRRSDGGPDAAFSLEPHELAELVRATHEATDVLGTPRFGPTTREEASIAFRRSLRAVKPIAAGEPITTDNVRSVRPAGGLPPGELPAIIGLRATRQLELGEPVTFTDLELPGE